MALFDESDVVSLPTLDYFASVVKICNLPGEKGAALACRFGMALALRHPEYAQAYVQMTDTPDLDLFGAEARMLDGFVRLVPITAVTEKE
ncbi:hypothetical protein LCGC14_1424450 [marine sediment metagenome]|uniref:Uncharacterized protein n=1 Tax=marine sediment metagenome TaxID=412755 RepID=A0A0F9JQ91_9ZZZZ